jgi:hypothetical protein
MVEALLLRILIAPAYLPSPNSSVYVAASVGMVVPVEIANEHSAAELLIVWHTVTPSRRRVAMMRDG